MLWTSHSLFYLIITPPSRRAEEATEAWRGEASCPVSPSKWAAEPKPPVPHPVPWTEIVIAGLLIVKRNQFSPDNRFHHSWNCRPGKKEDCLTAEANAFPEGGYWVGLLLPCVASICLTSDSELPVQPVCNLDSRTSPGTNQTNLYSGIGWNQSCPELPRLP